MAERNPRINTPLGTAQYPWLNRPDTKFKEHGEYKVNLIVPKKEGEAFIKKVEAHVKAEAKAAKAKKLANMPWEMETDDQGDETGNIILKCKATNKLNKDGELWDRKPVLFDAKGNKTDVQVGGGSKIKVNVELYTWNVSSTGFGVTLQINAVQIIELVELKTGASAETYGFEEEEGFEAGENMEEDETVSPEGEDEDLY